MGKGQRDQVELKWLSSREMTRERQTHVACDLKPVLRPESILPCRSSFSQTKSTIIIQYYTRSTDKIVRLVSGKVSALCLNMLGCSNGPTFINRSLPNILDLTLAIPQAQNGVDEVTQPLYSRVSSLITGHTGQNFHHAKHVANVREGFRHHSQCPVTGCECECAKLDGSLLSYLTRSCQTWRSASPVHGQPRTSACAQSWRVVANKLNNGQTRSLCVWGGGGEPKNIWWGHGPPLER
jgi:hypothetical protein